LISTVQRWPRALPCRRPKLLPSEGFNNLTSRPVIHN